MINDPSTSSGANQSIESSAMSESLIRVDRLKAYQKQRGWSDSELARQAGRSPSQVHAWYSGERNIGERLARQLEEQLKLPRLYLDERAEAPPKAIVTANAPRVGGSVQVSSPDTNRPQSIPVLGWEALGKMLTELNDKVDRALPRLDSYAAASANAKFVEMNDDSMAAEFQPGDHLLLDPETAPRAGDVVLVRTKAGEHLVRKYVPHTSRTFFARPINPDYASLSSAEDGLTVVATMIEHRRYRRPS